jgi:hypothetical protein
VGLALPRISTRTYECEQRSVPSLIRLSGGHPASCAAAAVPGGWRSAVGWYRRPGSLRAVPGKWRYALGQLEQSEAFRRQQRTCERR